MGDRCAMSITCRRCDRYQFESESYVWSEFDSDIDGCVELTDDEVNYGNTDNLPKDFPFTGDHGNGSGYGPFAFACDGQGKFMSVERGHGNEGYVVDFDEATGEPDPDSLAKIKEFILFRNKVEELLKQPVALAMEGGAD